MEISFSGRYVCGELTIKTGNTEIKEDLVNYASKENLELCEQLIDASFDIAHFSNEEEILFIHRIIEGRNLSLSEKKELVSLILNDEE